MTPDLAEPWLVRSAPVLAAQAAGRPLVALESTIIAHGMPYPENVRTAREVEAVIRATGAEPATIALIGGRIRIGLSDDELELLARSGNAQKVSRRDLPAVLASGEPGATTVAATMICAALAGIEVFVTGGIGGVHRGAQETFDISADLQELAKTSVAVVCAGAKSILDIGLTLEYLETHGVPVLSCGQDNFAAFYTRDSGFRADCRLDEPAQQARFIRTKWDCRAEHAGARSWRDAARGDRRDHPAGTGRSEGARHRGQGSDAVPAGPHQGDDRWAQPGDEHRAREAQRRSRREAGACR
jgi:pseudouridylate synthase